MINVTKQQTGAGLTEENATTLDDWTVDHQRAAFREGWCISEVMSSRPSGLQIHKVDDPTNWDQFVGEPCACLDVDSDAWKVVLTRNEEHHRLARMIIRKDGQQEWQLICEYARIHGLAVPSN